MAEKFPQFDQPISLRGGSDDWDSPAGEIVVPEYLETAPFAFPLSLAWDGFWRASWTLPWLGEASAGSSLGRDLYEAVDFPGSGAAQNGYTPAAFDGVDDLLVASGAAEEYFGAAGWTIHAVVKCTSLVAPGGFTADQPALFSVGPGSSAVALAFDSTGVTALQYDGIGGTAETPRIAVGTSTYRRIQARWTGTLLECRVDGGAWQSVACTSQVAYAGTGEVLRMGVNYDGTKFLAAEVLEGGILASALLDADLDALNTDAIVRYGLAGAAAFVGYGLPARARGGVGVLSLGGLTLASKGLSATTKGGVSQLASSLSLSARGLPASRRSGVSAFSTSLTLASKGLPVRARVGVSSLSLGVLPLTGQGLPTRTTAGSSAVSLGGLTLASKGLPGSVRGGVSTFASSLALASVGLRPVARAGASTLASSFVVSGVGLPAQLRAGSSVLSPGALALVGVGLPSATRGGVSTLTLGVSTTSLVAVGLPSQLRAGVATLTLGSVTLASHGLPTTTRGGSSTSTPSALALASKGLPTRPRGGANELAASFSVSARGLAASARGGASALALGPVALSARGLPASRRSGVSAFSTSLTLASKGLPAQLRAGVAASLPVFVVAARGLPARARGGASALTLGGLTVPLVGLPARTSCGVGLLELGGRSLVSIGLPASTRGGVGMLSVRAANQAGTVAIDLVPRALVAIEGAPRTAVAVDLAPRALVDFSGSTRADVALDLSPRALVAIETESQMSQPYRFDLGDDAVFTATFKLSETGELSDPTTLEVTVTPPTAPAFVVAYPSAVLERKSLGVYRLSIDCNEVGVWRAHFKSTGPAKAGEPVAWTVR